MMMLLPKLPPSIAVKRACLWIACAAKYCFIYACLAHLHPVRYHASRPHHYDQYIAELNITSLTFPLPLNRLSEFERFNRSISINVLSTECLPLYRTKNKNSTSEITLLYCNDHYYLLKHPARLLNRKNSRKVHYCFSCLYLFSTKRRYLQHTCQGKKQHLTTPPPGTFISFKNYKHVFKVPFIIYYDIESLLVPVESDARRTKHIPISVCSFTKCTHNDFTKPPRVFTGRDCIEQFLSHLHSEEARILHILQSTHSPLTHNEADFHRLQKARFCEVCSKRFGRDEIKYRDHSHLDFSSDSNVRYITCNTCNLIFGRQRTTQVIPVVAHNSSKYDMNFILMALKDTSKLKILARTSENFISMTLGKRLLFTDSMHFLTGSLDKLSSLLDRSKLEPYLAYITSDKTLHSLLTRKSIFPYDYMDSEERLSDTELPPKRAFYNTLTNSPVSDKDYNHAIAVWKSFQCRSLQDYMELYVTLDTMLLASVLEQYRLTTHKHFGLDPMWYRTAPSLCWDAMLKHTKIELECLSDPEMYTFFCKAIRGGITGTATRYAKTNNEYCKDYNNYEETSHILSFDVNNLYGMSLSLPLPTSGFRWMNENELRSFDIDGILENGNVGYFLEVDLDYPDHLHCAHNEFPLAPEKLDIPRAEWSPYTQMLADHYELKHKSTGLKLMLTVENKRKYILHHENLRLYLSLGLKLVCLHRGIIFRQTPFMKSYISLNTEARKTSKSAFEASLFKAYNNTVFGKTCYNVFKQRNIKVVSDSKLFRKLVAKSTYKGASILNERLVMVESSPDSVKCDKPIYIGATVLESSKAHMYSFYYRFLVPKYQKTGLFYLYGDTDSVYVLINNKPGLFNDLLTYEHYFDRSGYPPQHFLYSESRNREIGKLKDIHAHGHVTEFVALKSKMYAVKVEPWYDNNDDDDDETIKAKGVHRSVVRHMTFEDYKTCLFENTMQRHIYKQFRSLKHNLFTIQAEKRGICAYDDKRWILPCGIHSLPYGSVLERNRCPHCNL